MIICFDIWGFGCSLLTRFSLCRGNLYHPRFGFPSSQHPLLSSLWLGAEVCRGPSTLVLTNLSLTSLFFLFPFLVASCWDVILHVVLVAHFGTDRQEQRTVCNDKRDAHMCLCDHKQWRRMWQGVPPVWQQPGKLVCHQYLRSLKQ